MRQQVTKSTQRVHNSEEREQEPQDLGKGPHVGLFCHVSPRCAARNGFNTTLREIKLISRSPSFPSRHHADSASRIPDARRKSRGWKKSPVGVSR